MKTVKTKIRINGNRYDCNLFFDNECSFKIDESELSSFQNMYFDQYDDNFCIKEAKFYKKDYYLDNGSVLRNCFIHTIDLERNVIIMNYDYFDMDNKIENRNLKLKKILKNITNDKGRITK